MKKIVCLTIALLSLCSCTIYGPDGSSKKGKRTAYCSCYEPKPTPELDALGLNDSYKLNTHPNSLTSRQELRDKDDNKNVLFDNYQSAISFANELEVKAEYGHYNETIEFLKNLQEDEFQNKNLFLTEEITLGSGNYDLYFDAVYLKDDVLYMHGFMFDSNSPGASGKSFTTDVLYEAGYVWLDKDITYSECELVFDQDLRKPMVIEVED